MNDQSPDPIRRLREEAWIGDAVLELVARRWIMDTHGSMDGEMAARFTSNRFLAHRGDPTAVEAEIGRIYSANGFAAAEEWIRRELMPVFRRQEAKRRRK